MPRVIALTAQGPALPLTTLVKTSRGCAPIHAILGCLSLRESHGDWKKEKIHNMLLKNYMIHNMTVITSLICGPLAHMSVRHQHHITNIRIYSVAYNKLSIF